MFNSKKITDRLQQMTKLVTNATSAGVNTLKDAVANKENQSNSSEQLRNRLLHLIEKAKQTSKWSVEIESRIDTLENLVRKSLVKPKLAIVGMSDVGKSHLINTLLETEKIPSDWSPTTSVNIYIKHIEDRPHFLEEEILIFGGDENGFDVSRLDEEEYVQSHIIAKGGENLLKEYAIRQPNEILTRNIQAAIVYLDSPILKSCDIIDVPGFGTGDRQSDDQFANHSQRLADVIVYMSVSNAFMRGTDINFLKNTLDSLSSADVENDEAKAFANLFVLASQAHIIGEQEKLERILDAGTDRFYHSVPESDWKNRSELSGRVHSKAALRQRFYAYTTNNEKLQKKFENELQALLADLPERMKYQSIQMVSKLLEDQYDLTKQELINQELLLSKREILQDELHRIEREEPLRNERQLKKRVDVNQMIKTLSRESKFQFEDVYQNVMNKEVIAKVIKENAFKKDNQGKEQLVTYLSNELQHQVNILLLDRTETFVEGVQDYLEDFETDIKKSFPQKNEMKLAFDVKNVFLGGAAGAAALGGMAAYAAGMGNLGGYILVAKGAGLLAGTGFNIGVLGGMSGIMSGVAAIGGPVTLGIGMAVLVGVSTIAVLSATGWEEKLAKSIIQAFEKESVEEQYAQEIDRYWNETKVGFDTAANELEHKWEEHVAQLHSDIKNKNVDSIERLIEELKTYQKLLKQVELAL